MYAPNAYHGIVPRFEILEHTADIGVRAFGSSTAELFENAALAIQSIALDSTDVEPRQEYPLNVSGTDLESLLVNWLNEIVYYLDGPRVAMSRIRVESVTDSNVTGQGWGEPRDPKRHPPQLVVKAATYHQLSIRQENGLWTAEVYLDI
jgi:SHS2 domain-containing protein